jgi:Acetyltransferase (GNAT) domain
VYVTAYTAADGDAWDELVGRASMATFLHTRRYLSYHRDRFKDCSLLIMDDRERLAGLFPAALDPQDETRVVSHPGITYGGVLHAGRLRGERMIDALEAVRSFYVEQGFGALRYKAVPYIYHQAPSSDDAYALFRLGARAYRSDLSCAIDLRNRQGVSERRRRGLKRALKHRVQVEDGASFARAFWKILEENLASKYHTKPVHTVDEILLLHSLFPENIEFVAALYDGEVIAGVVLFASPYVVHLQYMASSSKGHDVCALDAVFDYCLKKAEARRARYFDFGISTEHDGQYLNAGLYEFKSEFGGGGVVHDFYELNLRSQSPL